jgi:hypothetical protein
MSQKTALLEHERKKLAWLCAKVAEQERRVALLEGLEDDPLDAILYGELATVQAETHQVQTPALTDAQQTIKAPVKEPAQEPAPLATPALLPSQFQWGQQPRLPRKVPANWVSLLRFLGRDGKTYEDVKLYIRDRGIPLTEGAARTQLMAYRKDFGFVENPKKGFYKATERALSFIDKQEGGSPVSQDEVSGSQPNPLARAVA